MSKRYRIYVVDFWRCQSAGILLHSVSRSDSRRERTASSESLVPCSTSRSRTASIDLPLFLIGKQFVLVFHLKTCLNFPLRAPVSSLVQPSSNDKVEYLDVVGSLTINSRGKLWILARRYSSGCWNWSDERETRGSVKASPSPGDGGDRSRIYRWNWLESDEVNLLPVAPDQVINRGLGLTSVMGGTGYAPHIALALLDLVGSPGVTLWICKRENVWRAYPSLATSTHDRTYQVVQV